MLAVLSEVKDPAPNVIKKAMVKKAQREAKEPSKFVHTDIKCAVKGCKNDCNKVRGMSDVYLTTCDKCTPNSQA